MTVRECYEKIEGNYEEAIGRFFDEARVKKYLYKFLESTSFSELCKSMEEKDFAEAFKCVHAMKGITANIAFTKLNNLCVLLTEELRDGKVTDKAWEYFDSMVENYRMIEESIKNLD